jgi:hypothetical protein
MALGSIQPLTEMSTRLTTLSENVGNLTSRNPKDVHGLYRENFTFTFIRSTLKLESVTLFSSQKI